MMHHFKLEYCGWWILQEVLLKEIKNLISDFVNLTYFSDVKSMLFSFLCS